MTGVAFDALRDEVLSESRAIEDQIDRAVRYAAIELCERAPVWQKDVRGWLPRGKVGSFPLIADLASAEDQLTAPAATGGFGGPGLLPPDLRGSATVDLWWAAHAAAGAGDRRSFVAAEFALFADPDAAATPATFAGASYVAVAMPAGADPEILVEGFDRTAGFSKKGVVSLNGEPHDYWTSLRAWSSRASGDVLSVRGVEGRTEEGMALLRGARLVPLDAAGSPQAAVHGVEWLRIGGDPWSKTSVKRIELLRRDPLRRPWPGDRSPGHWSFRSPAGTPGGRIELAPERTFDAGETEDGQAVDIGARWDARVVLKPRPDQSGFPNEADWILADHRETLAAGALWRLFVQARQPWTNERAAAFHMARWRQGLLEAAARAEGRRNAPGPSVRYGGIPITTARDSAFAGWSRW